jgi:DNA-binding response OmpR family regulator
MDGDARQASTREGRRIMAIDGRAARERFRMAKILIIEDDASARMTIVQLLEEAGHLVLWAVNGLQGMAVFRGWQPDLVITGIIMPDQEGIQTITEMRAAKPDAKIVTISGGGRIGNIDFLQIGAMDVVAKPFDPDFLLAVVENCLLGRALAATTPRGRRPNIAEVCLARRRPGNRQPSTSHSGGKKGI